MGFLDKLRGKKDQEPQQQQQQQKKEKTAMKEEPSSSSPSGQAGSAGHKIKRYTSEGKPVYD